MNTPDENDAAAAREGTVLIVMLVAASIAFASILLPFYGTVLWGTIIALLFSPMYRWLAPRLGRRRNLAAVLTLLAVILILIVPAALITASLAREAALVYGQIQGGHWDFGAYFEALRAALPDWLTELLERAGFDGFDDLRNILTEALTQGSQMVAKHAVALGQNTFQFVAHLGIALYLAFFLIRDGETISRRLEHAIPLAPDHKADLIGKFTTVVRATVKGSLLVAAVQGMLGGVAFWALGVNAALLWAVLMAFLSLLPAVGAALVWVPVAVWFLMSGVIWKGVALILWGTLVIGLTDNVLRPILVGKDTRMPDYVVLISTLGGMAVFGLNGFVIGPAIAAMFIAVWQIDVRTRPESGQ